MGHVKNLYINPGTIEAEEKGNFVGHKFELIIEVEIPGECLLSWYERTDKPYVNGMVRKEWNDMFEVYGASGVFKPWHIAQEVNAAGPRVIKLVDTPAILAGRGESRTRRLDFYIVVEGSDGTQKEVHARQTIHVLNGETMKCDFVIFSNNQEAVATGRASAISNADNLARSLASAIEAGDENAENMLREADELAKVKVPVKGRQRPMPES